VSLVLRSKSAACATLVVVVLLVGVLTACGDADDGGDGDPAAVAAVLDRPPPRVPPTPPPRDEPAPRWSTDSWDEASAFPNADGVLALAGDREIRGWGDPRVRRYVTALFRRMQYDFLAGDVKAVCRHLNPLLPTFLSDLAGRRDASCVAKMSAYAEKLDEQEFQSPPLRLLWVREYPRVAGVWVEDSRGKRIRIPFANEDGRGWRMQFAELKVPEALAMPLRAN